MTNRKISRLLALSDAEFGRKRPALPRTRFKALNVNLVKLSTDWDRQRGAAARMMAVILREDSETLLDKVSSDPERADAFADAVDWLGKEATYLRKVATRMDVAASRLSAAVSRYREQATAAGAT